MGAENEVTFRLPESRGAILGALCEFSIIVHHTGLMLLQNIGQRQHLILFYMLALTQECRGSRALGKKCLILFFPSFYFFSSLSFYFELGFHLPLQWQINSFFFFYRFGGLCEVHGASVRVRLRPGKEGRRSGGPERNEGVQGQSEGTDLFSQPVDEELIRGGGGGLFCHGGRGEEKEVACHRTATALTSCFVSPL